MNKFLFYALLLVFSFTSVSELISETIPVTGETSDQEIYNDGAKAKWVGQSTARIGGGKADQLSALVIPFKIPAITSGEVVSNATFSIALKSVGGGLIGNIDVHGLASSSSNTVRDDYQESGMLVYDNMITNSTATGKITVSGTDFANYINAQIENGAQTGDYIYLRLEADSNEAAYKYWEVYTSDGSPQPVLTLETGPAPVTILAPIGDQTSTEGVATTINISATDADGATMVFALPNKPSFVTLTDNGNGTAVINVSDQSTLGNHSIEVLVTADSNSDTETFNLEVKAPFVNTPPVLDPIGTLYAKTGVAKDFDISATDVDAGDVLVFSISGNPSFVTLSDNNDGTAVISVSDVAPEGVHENILITVTDGTGNDTETISVSVSAATVGGAYYCDPINGSMSNDGTSEATAWTTLEAVFSANKTFDDGDVIYLMNGDHGSTQIKSSNTDYVKITAYAGHNPIITKILFSSGASYWVVDNLKFEGFGVNSMSSAGLVNTYAGSDNITVSNCYFISVEDSKVFDYSNGTTEAIWKNQTSSGVKVTGDNTVVENCTFYNIHFGILLNGNNMKIENNLIDNFYADGIQIQGGGNNAIINGNTIRDAYVVDAQHDDGIQFWTNIGDGKIENVRITNNKVFNFADEITPELEQYGLVSEVMQGIILTDGWASNWVVENNLVVNSHTHGITIPGANNCRIQNNTNVKNPQLKDYVSSTSDPIIQTPTATKPSVKIPANSIVRNNLGTKIATWAFPGNFTVEGNYDIEQDDYNNYLACFVDYENQDFHLKETSPAVDTGSNNDLIAADLDGNDRLFGTKVDAGCYEYGSSPSSNVAPVLAPIGTISAIEGEAKSIAISATDANDDVLTFSILKGDKEFISLVDNGDGTASIEISDQSVTSIFTIEIKVFDGKLYDSEIVTIKIDNTLSTIENDLASFKIYPNPVKGNDINISFTKSSKEEQTVQLVSLTGRVVYSSIIVKGETKHQINNVEDLSQGVYLLQIGSSTKSTTKKVIID